MNFHSSLELQQVDGFRSLSLWIKPVFVSLTETCTLGPVGKYKRDLLMFGFRGNQRVMNEGEEVKWRLFGSEP